MIVAPAAPAFAQRANGPYAGVLGAAADPERTQGLDLHGSVDGSWDDDSYTIGDPSLATDPSVDPNAPFRNGGTSAGVSGSLTYDHNGDHLRLNSNAGTYVRRYQSMPDLMAAYQGALTLNADLTRKIVVNAAGDAGYSPFYGFSPFSAGAGGVGAFGPPIDPFSYGALSQRNLSYGGNGGLTVNFTKRTSFNIDGHAREWKLLDGDQNQVQTYGALAEVRHKVTRKLGVHAGYGQEHNQFAVAGTGRYTTSMIDVGVDYGDSLAIGRRAAFSFSTSLQGVSYAGDTHYRASGMATLTRGLGRSWSTWLGYTRSIDYQPAFLAPLLNDTGTAGISGLAALNVRWSAEFAGTAGTIGFDGQRYHTYAASTRLDRAITRNLAVYGQYMYYDYHLPPGATVWTIAPNFSRQIVTVGLTVWVPIFNQVRPPKEPEQR